MELLGKIGFRVKPGMTKYVKGLLSHYTRSGRGLPLSGELLSSGRLLKD